MDTTSLSMDEMRRALEFLALTNRWFGGIAVITRYWEAWQVPEERGKKGITVLDVGTGAADIPLALVRWGRRKGITVRVVGLDLVPEVIRVARARTAGEPDIEIRQGDLFDLAHSGERFDYVIASLFLHHMPSNKLLSCLQAFDRLSERGIVVSDLMRSLPNYAAVTVASWLLGNRVVRHDGPLSVKRSFCLEELQTMAHNAGLNYLRVRSEPWCRLSLAGRKT